MGEYNLQVTTGNILHAGTSDNIYVTLIGSERQSERTLLTNTSSDFQTGQTGNYTVATLLSLGCLLLLKVEKETEVDLPENEWHCSKIVVTTPDQDTILFPCHRWVSRGEVVTLRGGRATKAFEDDHPILVEHRNKELALQKELYQWGAFADGLPHPLSIRNLLALPAEVRFSPMKAFEFSTTAYVTKAELALKGLLHSSDSWESFEAMKNIFWFTRTPISEYVSKHCMEDDFFGYQFLNGANPNVIQRCSELPPNFPVTEQMVQPFLANGTSLAMEMKKGNIFLCDYKRFEGLPTRVVNGERMPVAAALCLFYMNPENKLLPIAIQLGQQPSEKNPIFLPSDSEYDWLLAKIFVRNTETSQHEIVSHLLSSHFIAEVFTVATLRNLPMIHPLYKMLIPHHRYTIQITAMGRHELFKPGSVLDNSTLSREGSMVLMRRALSEMTYSSLCLPDNIVTRGLESVPNFYFRDDGLRLWNITYRFVKGMVEYYYSSDSEVCHDSELQAWIREVFTYGFLGNRKSGIPDGFKTVEEVVKFITMVIYKSSAQHGAVSSGQYDYNNCIPNGPNLVRKSPPTTKGKTTLKTILDTLPDKGNSVAFLSLSWRLSRQHEDFIPLGTYPEEHFDEPAAKEMIKQLQTRLSGLSDAIVRRNSKLRLPYTYLNPLGFENSVTI